MPTYEYRCLKCGGSFEFRQSMKDPHLKECPQEACLQEAWGHGEVQRQLGTGAGLIFKGSGFYITDYRSDSYKAGAKADSSAGSSSGSAAPSTPAAAPAAAPAAPAPAPKPASTSASS
ncbi:MAG: zinc ribbon domain-containing protein [Verrucomicrobia bacterium]|nr:zinc ribbon domain-containing protein [Verrucomicrobiota bacterium]